MKLIPLGLIAGLAGALVGCKSTPKTPPAPPPPSASQIESMRTTFKEVSPNARIGVVTAVLDDASLVMVGDTDINGLAKGQVMTIVDSEQNAVGHGVIEDFVDGKVILRLQAGGTRAPLAGDAAIRF